MAKNTDMLLYFEYKEWLKRQSHAPLAFCSYQEWLEAELLKARSKIKEIR